jgi:hypothetical protein
MSEYDNGFNQAQRAYDNQEDPYGDVREEEDEYTDAQLRAYRQLGKAAERMGLNNYNSHLNAHIKAGKSKKTFRDFVTDEHREVIAAMSKVLSGEMSIEEANNLINSYEIEKQRLGK